APPSSTDDRFAAATVPVEMAVPSAMQDATMPIAPDFPGGVPLPRPRPAAAGAWPAQPGLAQDSQISALDSGLPAAQGDGGLLAAVTGGSPATNRVRSALAALGAGMTHVKNSPFKEQALANPFGAALEGGNKDEDRQYQLFTQRLAALDRALRARGVAVNPLRAAALRRTAAAVQRPALAPVPSPRTPAPGLCGGPPARGNLPPGRNGPGERKRLRRSRWQGRARRPSRTSRSRPMTTTRSRTAATTSIQTVRCG